MQKLPQELIIIIALYCDVPSTGSFAVVCSRMSALLSDPERSLLWQTRLAKVHKLIQRYPQALFVEGGPQTLRTFKDAHLRGYTYWTDSGTEEEFERDYQEKCGRYIKASLDAHSIALTEWDEVRELVATLPRGGGSMRGSSQLGAKCERFGERLREIDNLLTVCGGCVAWVGLGLTASHTTVWQFVRALDRDPKLLAWVRSHRLHGTELCGTVVDAQLPLEEEEGKEAQGGHSLPYPTVIML